VDPLVRAELRDAYRGRRVLVTGDTGFKGSWLALALHGLGADVQGFALPPEGPDDHYVVTGLDRLVSHRDGDVREKDAVAGVARSFAPDVVFHLAAQPLVRRSYEDPKLTFDTNVGGSVNVLEAVRKTPSVRALVFITSDKCYRNKEWSWGYRENDELGGDDPYSASKAAAELVFASYSASFFRAREGFGAASVRAGNVIGGGDWSDNRIVPDCVRALRAGQPIVIRSPDATRPWQHVLEPVFGYLLLGARLLASPKELSGAWNFGPRAEAERTVHELANAVVAAWGAGSVDVQRPKDAPHEAGLLALSCDKARHRLGWQAQWGFATAVAETIGWYRRVHDGAPALETSRAQIAAYLDGGGAP
jgi:CDP-glucose 4,6-dehydratase